MSATINLEKKHFPVLLDELIKIISPRYSGTFLDCTFGQGGYSKKILENSKNKVIAFDRDKDVVKFSEILKKNIKTDLNLIIKNLVKLKVFLQKILRQLFLI